MIGLGFTADRLGMATAAMLFTVAVAAACITLAVFAHQFKATPRD